MFSKSPSIAYKKRILIVGQRHSIPSFACNAPLRKRRENAEEARTPSSKRKNLAVGQLQLAAALSFSLTLKCNEKASTQDRRLFDHAASPAR